MADDPELVAGTVAYIRDNRISAARAFELRMLEFHSEWSRSGHPMIMDRLNDLVDIQMRVISRLLNVADAEFDLSDLDHPVILVARDLTPTLTVQLDREHVVGLVSEEGTRTAHAASRLSSTATVPKRSAAHRLSLTPMPEGGGRSG